MVLSSLMSSSVSGQVSLPRIPATEPIEAVDTLRLQNGFRAELIASEPMVTDPIAMTYDENGLAYVIEMNDYPYADTTHDQAWKDQTSPPLGRVRLLEDQDGDGKFDKSTVFAEALSWPSGLACWKGGLYVTATPNIWYLKDTDGDRKADIRREVFTGFRKYNVQAVINNLQWGLDHRIYAAGSSNGGEVHGAARNVTTKMNRSDFLFDPMTESFQLISGGARFGNSFDQWGHRFICNIRNPVQHVVMPAQNLSRNDHVPLATALQDVADAGDAVQIYSISSPEPWRVRYAARQAANQATVSPQDSTVPNGYVTSSSGVTIYRGSAYPPEFHGNAFVGEVAGNVVLRYPLVRKGVTFTAARPDHEAEFLASADNWFRPVNFTNAPDGTLHVLDMYRETIEHPWSMPDDLKSQVDLTSGRDRGRIYRLLPPIGANPLALSPQPQLGSASTRELVVELANPNGWWRETAHRLIFERQDRNATPALRSMLRENPTAVARLHAMWSLHGLEQLNNQDLIAALTDSNSYLRAQAIKLAEPRLPKHPNLLELVLTSAADADPSVRFQTALTLGSVKDSRAVTALTEIARKDIADPWISVAVISSLTPSACLEVLLNLMQERSLQDDENGHRMMEQLAYVAGRSAEDKELYRLITATAVEDDGQSRATTQAVVLLGMGRGLKSQGRNLTQAISNADESTRAIVSTTLQQARQTTINEGRSTYEREQAVHILSLGEFSACAPTLSALLDATYPTRIQLAALESLTSFSEPQVAQLIIEQYPLLTPEMRRKSINRLVVRSTWVIPLLDAIASGSVSRKHVAWYRREIYLQHRSQEIRLRANKLFGSQPTPAHSHVMGDYERALQYPPDHARGKQLARQECGSCHRIGNHGRDIGPNLATIKHRSPKEILVHILDPNREVSPNFIQYVIETTQGEVLTGVIAAETPNSITLHQAEQPSRTLLRSQIENLRSTGQSAMPEGLEKRLNPQEMANIIQYLKQSE